MDKMHRRTFNTLDDTDMSKGVVHATISASVVGVVEKNQLARSWVAFVNGAVFLHVTIDGFNVVFPVALNDATQSNLRFSEDGPHGTRAIAAKFLSSHRQPGFSQGLLCGRCDSLSFIIG